MSIFIIMLQVLSGVFRVRFYQPETITHNICVEIVKFKDNEIHTSNSVVVFLLFSVAEKKGPKTQS